MDKPVIAAKCSTDPTDQIDFDCLLKELKEATAAQRAARYIAARAGKDAWYQASYASFASAAPNTAAEFLKVVAFAYSWVATIPNGDPRPHFSLVTTAVKASLDAERARPYDVHSVRNVREAAIRTVQSALSIADTAESVVIVSKVLHFWSPDLAPMIDVNVARGFKKLAKVSKTWNEALMKSGNPRITTISDHPRVEQYLSYWELAHQFAQSDVDLNYRGLDELLFCYGR